MMAVHGNKRYQNSEILLTDSYSNVIMKLPNGGSPYGNVHKGAENKMTLIRGENVPFPEKTNSEKNSDGITLNQAFLNL